MAFGSPKEEVSLVTQRHGSALGLGQHLGPLHQQHSWHLHSGCLGSLGEMRRDRYPSAAGAVELWVEAGRSG